MRDPYKILGVPRDAGADEIKAAWRSKAKSAHPDHNPDDPTATARFAEIGRAYETLKDPKKRSRFDQLARMAEAKNAARAGNQTIMQQRQAAEAAARDKAARAETVMEELARAKAQKARGRCRARSRASRSRRPERRNRPAGSAGRRASGGRCARISRGYGRAYIRRQAERRGRDGGNGNGNGGKAPGNPRQYAEAVEQQEEVGETEAVLAAGGIGAIIGRPPLAILSSLVRRFTGQAPSLEKAPDIAAEATLDDRRHSQGQLDFRSALRRARGALPGSTRHQRRPGGAAQGPGPETAGYTTRRRGDHRSRRSREPLHGEGSRRPYRPAADDRKRRAWLHGVGRRTERRDRDHRAGLVRIRSFHPHRGRGPCRIAAAPRAISSSNCG